MNKTGQVSRVVDFRCLWHLSCFECSIVVDFFHSKYDATYLFLGEAQYCKIADIDIEIELEILRSKFIIAATMNRIDVAVRSRPRIESDTISSEKNIQSKNKGNDYLL